MSNLAIPITILERTAMLREMSFGIREGLPRSTSVEQARKIIAVQRGWNESRWNEVDVNEETEEAVRERISLYFDWLSQRIHQHFVSLTNISDSIDSTRPLRVLIVSHGGFIRRIFRLYSAPNCVIPKLDNASISILDMKIESKSATLNYTILFDLKEVNLLTL